MAPSVSSAAPVPGTLVAGKYRVDRILGAGGMGVIVEAEHAALGQRVAIKFLLSADGDTSLIERFLREARAVARLRSDHVVRVFDIGTDDRGVPFMVMELLSGTDLSKELDERGALPVVDAVTYILGALDAIIEAHAAGVVHRDLKPANLFLAETAAGARRVKVLDFGISKLEADAAHAPNVSLTATRAMLGSPAYMSPEQVRSSKSVDARTDIWALGVILYEMLSGKPAFDGETLGDIFAKIREEDLPPIRTIRPDVPEELAAVVHGCLVRDSAGRIPDAIELRRRLLPFASSAGAVRESQPQVVVGAVADAEESKRVVSASTIPGPMPSSVGAVSSAAATASSSRSRRVIAGFVGVVAVGALFAIAATGMRAKLVRAEPSSSAPVPSAAPTAVVGALGPGLVTPTAATSAPPPALDARSASAAAEPPATAARAATPIKPSRNPTPAARSSAGATGSPPPPPPASTPTKRGEDLGI